MSDDLITLGKSIAEQRAARMRAEAERSATTDSFGA
jgi:hypothetical protein